MRGPLALRMEVQGTDSGFSVLVLQVLKVLAYNLVLREGPAPPTHTSPYKTLEIARDDTACHFVGPETLCMRENNDSRVENK